MNDSQESLECLKLEVIEDFTEVFPTELPETLPSKRFVDHHIDLLPGTKPFSRAPYRLSKFETNEVEKVVHELLFQVYIRPIMSPCTASVLFAPNKDGKLRFCVDYRALSRQTVRNYFPIPLTDVLIVTIISILNLWSRYEQVSIHPPDIPKTVFVTPFGHFEYLVVPFAVMNAPSAFQNLMNSLLGYLLFVSANVDDKLVCSKKEEEHVEHLRRVLTILKDSKLHTRLAK
jgi:hypothetical protein